MGLFSAKPSVNAQKIIDWLGCECEYFPAGKPAQFISSTYEDAFAKKEMGGYTPVIIVVNDVLSEWFDMLREDSGTSPEDRRREDRKSTRLNSSHANESRMPSSA